MRITGDQAAIMPAAAGATSSSAAWDAARDAQIEDVRAVLRGLEGAND